MVDELLITGARVLAADLSDAPLRDVLIRGDRIAALTAPGEIDPATRPHRPAPDRLIVPGLVNGHTHSHGALAKGLVGDRVALEVFLASAPAVLAGRTVEDKALSARLSAVELIRMGCTACFDLFTEVPVPSVEAIHAVAAAYAETGLRAIVAPMIATKTLWQALPGLMEALPPEVRARVQGLSAAPETAALDTLRTAFAQWPEGIARPGVAPTIPLHCSDTFLQNAARLAADYDAPFQTHLAETEAQATLAFAQYGKSLTAHLAALGILGPNVSAAHGIWLSDDDLSLLADHGTGISHNPMSNLRIGSGVAPVRAILEAGVTLGLGTDATNTSDGQNMFEATRLGATLSRVAARDPSAWLSAEEAFTAATTGSARLLGLEKTGRIEEGWAADLVFLDLATSHYVPFVHPLRQLVFAENGAAVTSVMIAGRLVLDEGRLTTLDEAKLRAEAEAAAARLNSVNAPGIKAAEALGDLAGCFCLGLAPNPQGLARRLNGESR